MTVSPSSFRFSDESLRCGATAKNVRVLCLAFLLCAAMLWPSPASAQPSDGDPPCPEPADISAPAPSADSVAWVRHAREVGRLRACTPASGELFVREARAWYRVRHLRKLSDLGMRILRSPARSDSANVSRVLHIAGVAASLDSRPNEATHLFRTASYYLSARPVAERVGVYVEWAEAAIRQASMTDARTHLTAAKQRMEAAPAPVPAEAAVLVYTLEAWSYLLPAIRDRVPPPPEATAALDTARSLRADMGTGVWQGVRHHAHHVDARLTATQNTLSWLNGHPVSLSDVRSAEAQAREHGDAWAKIQARFVEALVHLRNEQTADAYDRLEAALDKSETAPEPVLIPHLLLTEIRVAAVAGDPERARNALTTLSRLSFVPPPLFEVASSTVMNAFDDGWTGSTWAQVLLLALALSVIFQLAISQTSWSPPWSRTGTGEEEAPDTAFGTTPPGDAPVDADAPTYRSPHDLRDPRINRHATVSFDTHITLDPEEIATIIDATSFTASTGNANADRTGDHADAGPGTSGPGTSGSATSGSGTPSQTTEGETTGGDDAGGNDGGGRIEVPCYAPDGTRRDPVDLPASITRGLMERRIIALEVDGEILVLYRFETGAQRIVHYDPDTETFTDLDLGDTFHGFPIARLDDLGK